MPKSQKLTGALMTVLAAVAFYLFFALKYPYHLHFQEQYQLFEWTWAYFAGVAWAPGGIADWLGRLLTQFFYYAPAGAAIMALLLCIVPLLSFAVCGKKTLEAYALSFIPAVLLLAFFCDENALAGGAVAIILSLAAAALCLLIRKDRTRQIVACVAVPAVYLVCGSLGVIFVLAVIVREFGKCGGKAWRVSAVMIVLLALAPVAASRVFPYPLQRLYYGVHYYRYHNVLPGLLWLAALGCVVPVLAASFLKGSRKVFAGAGIFAAVAAAGIVLTIRTADMGKEEWMKYDFMVRMKMWNRLMQTADAKNPANPKTVSCLNLALAMTGRMADFQFQYFQNGPEGLLPGFAREYTNPVSTGEIYWNLGMVNTAQRYAFEAQESIPDFQKSARCYKRLVETNLVNGDDAVAGKYLSALEHTTFYRKWARETRALMEAGTVFENRPEMARARALRLKEHDFLFSDAEMDSMLGLLKVENPDNPLALSYLMAWCLLKKDLDRFVECIGMVDTPTMPKGYQEALILRWVLTHSDFSGLPDYISRAWAQRMSAFIADSRAGKTEAEMKALYGDTYWFYYYYRYRSKNE